MTDLAGRRASARRDRILDELRRSGRVRSRALVAALQVSDMTVRRDLAALAALGLLVQVHGGARAPDRPDTHEPDPEVRERLHSAEKDAIAQAALAHLAPGATVGLADGTTTARLAARMRDLVEPEHLTVVTSSVLVAERLPASEAVLLTGGRQGPADALVGSVALASVHAVNLDLAFVGTRGLSPEGGLTAGTEEVAAVIRAFVESAATVVVLADHSKLGVRGPVRAVVTPDVDVLVTDDGASPGALAALEAAGIAVVVAAAGGARQE